MSAGVTAGHRPRRSTAIRWLVALVLAGAFTLVSAAPVGAFVYWSDLDNAISRANLDGSATTPGFLATYDPGGVAVDGTHVYYSGAAGTGLFKIWRANLDGSGAPVPIADTIYKADVAVSGEYVYWTTAASIARARLDGSELQPFFIVGMTATCGVAVNGTHIFWGDAAGNRVGRANLDGTAVNLSYIAANAPCGVAVNATHVFWGNTLGASIGRANLNGSGVNQNFITGAIGICDVDVNDTHIYWSRDHFAVARASLDGSGVNQDFIQGRMGCGVALDPLTTAALAVTPSASQITYGQDITLDAAVSGAGVVPTGSVQFFVNDAPEGAAVALNATGHAILSPSSLLNVGDRISAAYSGDTVYGAVRVPDASPIVQPAQTTTQVTAEPATVVTGSALNVTATVTNTVTDITPFGSVVFEIDGEQIGPPFELDDNGQVALGLVANVPAADYLVTVRYFDDTAAIADFLPSVGTNVVRVVAPPPPPPPPTPPTPPAGGPSTPLPAVLIPTVVPKQGLAAVGASLVKALKARGFAALTGPLTYTAPGPGTLSQRVFAQAERSKAKGALAKETLIASGSRAFTAAVKGTLRPRLTAAGRRMTNRAKRLKLRIVTRFAPFIGTTVSASQRATISRRGGRTNAEVNATGWRVITRR